MNPSRNDLPTQPVGSCAIQARGLVSATLLVITGIWLLFLPASMAGPFAPAAGQPGSTAISYTNSVFSAWATGYSEIVRGPMQIDNPDLGNASFGEPENALESASNDVYNVVSLGDGGWITLMFDKPIANGPGYDFAVFENAFNDTFLELGFVEVSSDGVNFHRFNAVSVVQTNTQIGGFGTVDPTEVHNFAGKYRVGFGTPFNLEELAARPGLNVNAVTHVRVIDVVGCIQDEYATYDSTGRKVNDPWPTPFASSGFDLDAVGVIHQAGLPSSITGTNGWTAERYFSNPHTPAPLISFDWDAGGELFYTTGDASWGSVHAAYRFIGIAPVLLYSSSAHFAGASMTVIGDYAYFNNSDWSNNQLIRKYGPLDGTPAESLASSTWNYSIHGHDGAMFISGADATWTAFLFHSELDASGNLVPDPAIPISTALTGNSGPITFDADGNMYYADGFVGSGDPRIYKWSAAEVAAAIADPAGSPLTEAGNQWATITGGFDGASGMAIAPDGSLILTATSFTAPSQVQRFTVAADGSNSGMTIIATSASRAETVRVHNQTIYVNNADGIARLLPPPPPPPRGTIFKFR